MASGEAVMVAGKVYCDRCSDKLFSVEAKDLPDAPLAGHDEFDTQDVMQVENLNLEDDTGDTGRAASLQTDTATHTAEFEDLDDLEKEGD